MELKPNRKCIDVTFEKSLIIFIKSEKVMKQNACLKALKSFFYSNQGRRSWAVSMF